MVSDFSQNLTVKVDLRFIQASDELAVSDAMATSRGIDTRNPQATEHALFIAAVAVKASIATATIISMSVNPREALAMLRYFT